MYEGETKAKEKLLSQRWQEVSRRMTKALGNPIVESLFSPFLGWSQIARI